MGEEAAEGFFLLPTLTDILPSLSKVSTLLFAQLEPRQGDEIKK